MNSIVLDKTDAWSASNRTKWLVVSVLAFLHILALFALSPAMLTARALLAFVVLIILTQLFGLSIGFHRLLAHKSFCTSVAVRFLLALVGTLSLQGGPVWWVAIHRLHHKYPDTDHDIHSPNQGFLWSHFGWTLVERPTFRRFHQYAPFAGSIGRDRSLQFLDRTEFPLQALLWGALYAYGGWPCVLWGGAARLVCTYHCTWLVGSAAHRWGYRRYSTSDEARNLWWVSLLTYGEGWHNNHHRMPYSARHGHVWWELDIGWLTLLLLKRCGLVWSLRTPMSR